MLSTSVPEPNPRSLPARRRSVLVVDDDPAVVDMFTEALRERGYEAHAATSGEEALLRAHRACAVIVDFRMPALDGLGFVRRLRERDANMPVAVVTGDYLIESAVLEQFATLGVRVVFKPVWLDQLVALATELLRDRIWPA
jgi:CheY-like chemotaxis protein